MAAFAAPGDQFTQPDLVSIHDRSSQAGLDLVERQ
jgi:hypothetical protein